MHAVLAIVIAAVSAGATALTLKVRKQPSDTQGESADSAAINNTEQSSSAPTVQTEIHLPPASQMPKSSTEYRQLIATEIHARLLHDIFQNAAESMITITRAGQIVDCNPSAELLFGASRDELCSMHIAALLPDPNCLHNESYDPAEQLTSQEFRMIGTGREVVGRRSDGTNFPLWISFSETQIGSFHGFTGLLHDLTPEKEAQRALRESEERFQLAVKGSNDGIWDWDCIDNTFYFSSRFHELLELEPNTLKPAIQEWFALLHPEDADGFIAAMQGHLDTNVLFDYEARMLLGNGEYKWFRTRGQSIRDDEGLAVRMAGSITDVSLQRAFIDELSRVNEMLRQAEVVSGVGGWQIAVGSNDMYWSDEVRRLFGADDSDEPTFEKFLEPFTTDGAQIVQVSIQQALKGNPFDIKLAYTSEDPDETWVRLKGNPVFDEEGQVIHVAGAILEITEQLRKQQQLTEQLKKLEAANKRIEAQREELIVAKNKAEASTEAKSEFIANMSHEIRTPMAGILGMIGLLLETNLNEEQEELSQIAHASAESLLTILNDILDFSKAEAGHMQLYEEQFEVAPFLQHLQTLYSLEARSKGITFDTQLDSRIPTSLIGDSSRLRQVLINLIGNALKFTKKEENVQVSIKARTLKHDHCQVEFSVQDTGIGIPEDVQKSIFEAFSQADSSITRKYGGTGLGLAISSTLVDLMGGQLKVESEEGVGSTFSFTIPLKIPEDQRVAPKKPKPRGRPKPPPTDLSHVRILLAEDNKVNQILVVKLLSKFNCSVFVAENGKEAVDKLQEEDFDLILMDLQMPIMSGDEATKCIRALDQKNDIPIVALTANAMAEDRKRCMDAGMNAFITKPLKSQELIQTIHQLVPAP